MSEAGSTRPTWPGFQHAVVGVEDLAVAHALWVDTFGFELVHAKTGADAELSRLWQLPPTAIAAQSMVRTPGQSAGWLHLVQFSEPLAPVRQDAQVYDLCPKNLDVQVLDLPAKVQALRAAGVTFLTNSHIETTAPDGTAFREIHMPAHDGVNVVLVETPGAALPFSPRGFAGVHPLVSTVANAAAEKAFYAEVLGLTQRSENVLEGPDIETLIGLPPGAGLDVSVWGHDGTALGGLEIVEYRNVSGRDLYPAARPPARGVLHVVCAVDDLEHWTAHLRANVLPFEELPEAETLLGRHRSLTLATPAGLRIELRQYLSAD